MIELYQLTLLPWIGRIEAVLDAQLPRGTELRIEVDGLLRADTKTRFETYAIAIDKGILTVDEVRALETRPPLARSAAAMSDIVHATFGAARAAGARHVGTDRRGDRRAVGRDVVPDPRPAGGTVPARQPDPHDRRERGDRVKLFRTHDHDQAVGKPVAWKPDHELGCWAQFRIGTGRRPATTCWPRSAKALLDAFSVGFLPIRRTRGADGAREIIEARLHEVSHRPDGRLRRGPGAGDAHPGRRRSTLPPMPDGQPGAAADHRA